ncbi:Androgen-dependent TFPI-regulating protein [Merluccius polli]|uniref:Androgen-dependent TFPI-regulating protein n=1 Tax=Merluccius polli TaxID=89951 RepID=A0AA47N144_MERPO|nr:Androgen-dependent TFPI-regulating protein [Merluccius polli]
MKPTLSTVHHVAAFCWYAFVVRSLAAKDGEDLPPGIFVYGGPWKYLTFLNLASTVLLCIVLYICWTILQMVYFGLAAVSDLHAGKKSSKILNRCKDLLFSVFVFPIGMVRTHKNPLLQNAKRLDIMFVVLLFWMIFAYDRELVYPATIDTFFPPWMNHAMHTFVFPILLGEFLVQPHFYPKTQHGLGALGVVGLSYLSWYVISYTVIWVYLSVGIWVYPLLGLFSNGGLVGLFLFNMSVVTLLYLLGEKLNCCVWGK